MALLQLWFMKADAHYDITPMDPEIIKQCPGVDPEPFHCDLKGECDIKEFFSDTVNPFDLPIMDECDT